MFNDIKHLDRKKSGQEIEADVQRCSVKKGVLRGLQLYYIRDSGTGVFL